MGDAVLLYKLLALVWGLLTLGLGWWLNDLKDKHKRTESRIDKNITALGEYKDKCDIKLSDQRDRLTRLESDAITELQVVRMITDSERRVMENFTAFRTEFKEDFALLSTQLREDLNRFNRD